MEKRFFTGWRIGLILVFAVSVVLYLPSIMGGLIWDDFDLISGAAFGKNSYYSAFTHPFLGHYFRPLTSASFVFDSSFARATPFFYHQTNILLHAITAVLVSLLTFRLTRKPVAGILAGLFLATQPLQVGATAWIGGRTDVMSAAFLAAFMLVLVEYYQKSKKGWLIASVVFYFLAGCAKEQALAVLPAVPLSVFVFGTKKWKDAGKICIPFLVAIIVIVVMWFIDAPAPAHTNNSFLSTVVLAFRTAGHYGLAFLTPNKRSLLTWTTEGIKSPLWVLAGVALVAASSYCLWYCWRKHRAIAWVAICALLVYIPISNFPTVPSFVLGPYRCAEAGTGVACLFGAGMAWTFSAKRWPLALPFALNLVVATMVSWWGIHLWNDPVEFFSKVAATDPHFIVGVGNYAQGLNDRNQPKESLKWTNSILTWIFQTPEWRGVLRKEKLKAFTAEVNARLCTNGGNPDTKALGWFASVQATSYAHLKRTDDAIDVEIDALALAPKDPRIQFSYGQLILKYDRKQAIEHWEYALKLSPHFSACAAALAHERLIDGRFKDAVNLLEPQMANLSWDSEAWIDLSDAKAGLHDFVGASAALDSAERSVFVKKDLIKAHRKKLKELIDASRHRH